MAKLYGAEYTKLVADANTGLTEKVSSLYGGGSVRVAQDKYTTTADTAQNDTVYLAKLPPHSIILPGSEIVHGALGASVTLSVGTIAEPAKYLAATSAATAGRINVGLLGTYSVPATVEEEIVVTIGGAKPSADIAIVLSLLHVHL